MNHKIVIFKRVAAQRFTVLQLAIGKVSPVSPDSMRYLDPVKT